MWEILPEKRKGWVFNTNEMIRQKVFIVNENLFHPKQKGSTAAKPFPTLITEHRSLITRCSSR
jgi:hypothetical protein